MKSVIDVYYEIANKNPVWSPEEERFAIRKWCNKRNRGKFGNEAFKHNLWLVFKLVEKFAFSKFNEDVVQCAAIGLMNGLKSFDPTKGSRISTWVYDPIKWAILKHHHTYSKQGMIVDDLIALNKKYKTHFSIVELDKPIGGGNSDDSDDMTCAETIGIDSTSIDYIEVRNIKTLDEETRESDIKDAVKELICGKYGKFLSDKEKFVIEKLASGMNQAEISRELKVTRMRVSQIAATAYDKIRKSRACEKLRKLVK